MRRRPHAARGARRRALRQTGEEERRRGILALKWVAGRRWGGRSRAGASFLPRQGGVALSPIRLAHSSCFAIGLLDRLATHEFACFCSDRAASPAGAVSDLPGLFG